MWFADCEPHDNLSRASERRGLRENPKNNNIFLNIYWGMYSMVLQPLLSVLKVHFGFSKILLPTKVDSTIVFSSHVLAKVCLKKTNLTLFTVNLLFGSNVVYNNFCQTSWDF